MSSDDEISERSVGEDVDESSDDESLSEVDNIDFDPYSDRQINWSIDKLLQISRCPEISQRDAFFNTPRLLVEEKGSKLTNMVDQVTCKRYNLPNDLVPQAMKLLNECRIKKIYSGFSERQNEYSGIMIDLDLLVKTQKSYLDHMIFHRMTAYIVKVLQKFLRFRSQKDREQIHLIFMRKPEVIFSAKHKAYKDGLHILIPGVQVTKKFKKYLFDYMQKDGGIREILKDTGYINLNEKKFIDPNAAHVFVIMAGCIKQEASIPYEMEKAYMVTLFKDSPTIEDATESIRSCNNLVYELSLNWQDPTGIIKKRKVKCKKDIDGEINTWNDQHRDNILDEEELMETKKSLSTLCLQDPDVRYWMALLEIVDVEKAEDRNMWWKIVNVLSRTRNDRYRVLAYYFSQRCPQKYTKQAVDEVWNDCLTKHYDINIKIIERWAKEDSPRRYEEIKKASAFEILQKAAFEFNGDIHDAIVAKLLKILLRGKYVVGIPPGKTAQAIWFEFITLEDKHKQGEAFKYRCLGHPINMKTYISDILPSLYNQLIEYIKTRIEKAEPSTQKYLIKMKKNLETSKVRLTKDQFNRCVVSAAIGVFNDPEFLDKLDAEGSVMGVGNGILLLGSECTLIDHYHEYIVSRYTPVIYRPFDGKGTWIKKLHGAFRAVIPEKDAFLKIMYYLSLGLDGKTKDSLMLFLVGSGANGKSFLLEMITNSIGQMYARKMPISFITGSRGDAQGPNPALMELKTARMVYYSEPQACERLNVGAVKEMLGQEKMSGRTHHSEQENFKPSCIHVACSNYDFEITCHDFGTWRRILYYVCKMKFVPNPDPNNKYERMEDPSLGKSMTSNPFAMEATLSILVYYYEQLQRRYGGHMKNVPSPTIASETQQFQNRQDTINEFICQMVVRNPNEKSVIQISLLAELYDSWHEANKSQRIQVRSQIIANLENSILNKYILTNDNGVRSLSGHRVKRDPTEKPREGDITYYAMAPDLQQKRLKILKKSQKRGIGKIIDRISQTSKDELIHNGELNEDDELSELEELASEDEMPKMVDVDIEELKKRGIAEDPDEIPDLSDCDEEDLAKINKVMGYPVVEDDLTESDSEDQETQEMHELRYKEQMAKKQKNKKQFQNVYNEEGDIQKMRNLKKTFMKDPAQFDVPDPKFSEKEYFDQLLMCDD